MATVPGTDISTSPPRTSMTCTAVCRTNRWSGCPTDLTPLTTWSLRTITASGLPALVDAALG